MDWRRKLLEDVRLNYKDIELIVAWFVFDSLMPQNVYVMSTIMLYLLLWCVVVLHRLEAKSLEKHSSLMDVRAIHRMIVAYASYTAGTPRTPDTTDTEEEGIEWDVIINNYIAAKLAEVLEKMKVLILI